MSQLSLSWPDAPDLPAWHLSVDGMSPTGPNLSHWPGNRTPARWKADLSTEICLHFAAAPAAEQAAFLAGATVVLNDHYDTDGFLSLLAVLRPEVALARRDTLRAAAATGDFQAFQDEAGFAIDRIVANLAADHSPVAGQFAGLAPGARDHARYGWLLEHAVAVLDDPGQFAVLYRDELAQVQHQLADRSITVEPCEAAGLALCRSPGPVRRLVLNTLAHNCFRVLHTERCGAGHRYRFHDRTESWFEVQSFRPPPRTDLEPVRAALQELEPAGDPDAVWCLDPADEPVPELYYGVPAAQEYGQLTRELRPSRIPPERVERLFLDHFGG